MTDSAANTHDLAATVLAFAEATRAWPDRHLESAVWGWDEYHEVRYAHLHTVMTLRALAARHGFDSRYAPLHVFLNEGFIDSPVCRAGEAMSNALKKDQKE